LRNSYGKLRNFTHFEAPAAKAAGVNLKAVPVLILCLGLFSGCLSGSERLTTAGEGAGRGGTGEPYEVLDYKGRAEGEAVPGWAEDFLAGAPERLESRRQYRYVFTAHNSGTNFRGLSQWSGAFSADEDFPRLAAARITARFSRGVENPDLVYGRYFEGLIRAASDAVYQGAVREDDFWIKRRFFEKDGFTVNREVHDFIILITIDRSLFASQVREILDSVKPVSRLTRDQNAQVNRVKEHFFEGF
jgi:hypothetical protein